MAHVVRVGVHGFDDPAGGGRQIRDGCGRCHRGSTRELPVGISGVSVDQRVLSARGMPQATSAGH